MHACSISDSISVLHIWSSIDAGIEGVFRNTSDMYFHQKAVVRHKQTNSGRNQVSEWTWIRTELLTKKKKKKNSQAYVGFNTIQLRRGSHTNFHFKKKSIKKCHSDWVWNGGMLNVFEAAIKSLFCLFSMSAGQLVCCWSCGSAG